MVRRFRLCIECARIHQPGAVLGTGSHEEPTGGYSDWEGLSAVDLNDDMLGRSLDNLYEAGVTEVFAGVARNAPAIPRS